MKISCRTIGIRCLLSLRANRVSLCTIGILAMLSNQLAAEQLFDSPRGFWVSPKTYNGTLIGPTSADANWHFTQWNSPSPMKGFVTDCLGEQCRSVSSNQRGVFTGGSWDIAQHGQNLTCGKEFAAFAQANSTASANYPGYPSGRRDVSPALADLEFLHHTIAIQPIYQAVIHNDCALTQGGDISAIVFKNTVNNHTFFYQIKLTAINFVPRAAWWQTGFEGPSWGYGDVLANYGETEAVLKERKYYALDVLPKVSALLESGRAGIDSDLNNWVVSGVYHGSHVWGGVANTARWDSFSLSY